MGVWLLIWFRVICFQTFLNTGGKLRLTRRLRRIHNAWRSQLKLNLVFNVQWFGFGGWRCSPLNAALVLGWHQRLKVSVFIGLFSSLYIWSNVPFRFAPVALDVKFSLWVYRLRFLTFGLFLWRVFFGAEKFSAKQAFLYRSCSSLKPVFFTNLKAVKKGSYVYFSSSQLTSWD